MVFACKGNSLDSKNLFLGAAAPFGGCSKHGGFISVHGAPAGRVGTAGISCGANQRRRLEVKLFFTFAMQFSKLRVLWIST